MLALLLGFLSFVPVTAAAAAAPAPSATHLVFQTSPGNSTAATAFAAQPVVVFTDADGNTVASTATVNLSIKATTGATGAVLGSCPAVVAVAGTATFAGCKIDKAATGYQLTATSGALTGTSASFTVTVGAIATVKFTTQPTSGVAGALFAPAVGVYDAGGNLVPSDTAVVGLAAAVGVGQGPLTCTGGAQASGSTDIPAYKLTTTGGIATFTKCTITDASTSLYQLVAVTGVGSTVVSATSDSFAISSGGAARLAFTTNPTGGLAGAAFSTAPVVAIQDAAGNLIGTGNDPITLSLTPGSNPNGAVLSCAPATAVAGLATFAGCSIDKVGTNYTVTASGAGFTATSAKFSVNGGDAAAVAFTRQPGNGTGGAPLASQPVLEVSDAAGNKVSGAVTLALTGGTTGAKLSCPTNPAPAGLGTAELSGCSVDRAGTGYRIVATLVGSPTVTATSSPFAVTAGPAATIAFVGSPTGATGGNPFSGQPTVALLDLGGNRVAPTGATTLAITAGSGAPGAQLQCSAPTTDGALLVSFSGCRIDKLGTGYRVVVSSGGFTATSNAFTVTGGAAAKVVFRVQPGGAVVGSPLGSQPQVLVTDAGGNPVSPVSTTVTLTPSTGTLTCRANAVPTTTGTAAFSGCQLSAAGTLTLTASAPGLTAATSTPFAVAAGTPLPVPATGLPLRQTFGAAVLSRNTTAVVDDVNTATGALQVSYSDLTVAGLGLPLDLTRHYNSLDTTGGAFGPGWSSILDAGVSVNTATRTAVVRGEDGQQLVYTGNGPDVWVAPAGATATLVCHLTDCIVTRKNGDSFRSIGGRIQNYLSADRHGLKFTYQNGRVTTVVVENAVAPVIVAVTLDATGQVTRLASPTRSVGYAYTGTALTRFTDAAGQVWSYAYGAGLTQVVDPLGHVRLSVGYSGGRVSAAAQLGSQNHFVDTYAWNQSAQVATRTSQAGPGTDPAVSVETYRGNVLVNQVLPSGASMAYGYDSQFRMVASQDPMGRRETLTYNTAGDLTAQSVPATATTTSTTRISYDTLHRPLSVTDASGNTTRYAYNGSDETVISPGTGTSQTWNRYNALGELAEARGPLGIQRFRYDGAGNQTGFQWLTTAGASLNGAGPVTTFDEAGHRLVSADARGNTGAGIAPAYRSVNVYDATGNLLSSTTAGQTTATGYSAAGDVTSTTDTAGRRTSVSWDESTLTSTATGPAGPVSSTFDRAGRLLSRTDAGHRTTSYRYDAAGLQISSTDPANITTTFAADVVGNVTGTSDTAGHRSTFSYDAQNRPLASTVDGVTTSSTYDAAGNVVAQTDGAGHRRTFTFTSQQQIASVTDPAGTTSYRYDAAGNRIATIDGNGHVTGYTYNAAHQQTAMTVNGKTWTYGYDAAGNVTTTTDPDGRTTRYTLDANNLRTRIDHTQAGQAPITVTQAYDALGRRTAMTDSTGTHTFSYDAAGNLAKADNGPTNTFTYDYSVAGRMTETYPDGTASTYAYDDAHNVMALTSGAVSVSYLRNIARQVTGVAYSNGIVQTQSYDAAGAQTGQVLSCGGVTQLSSATSYDAAGKPLGTASTVVGGSTTQSSYGYDAGNRLAAQSVTHSAPTGTVPGACTPGTTSALGAPNGNDGSDGPSGPAGDAPTTANQPTAPASAPGTGTSANPVRYDAAGNRISSAGTTSSYDAADQLTAQTGADPATFTYDGAGNLTSSTAGGATTRYSYDAAARLVGVTTGGTTVAYAYDGDGNRVRTTTTTGAGTTVVTSSWDPNAALPLLALERDGSNNLLRRYLYGVGVAVLQTPAGTFYLHTDQQGDVTAMSDKTGAVIDTYSYTAFGAVTRTQVGTTAAPDNPMLFQGQYLDPVTGLYNMRARQYDPNTGRFTQRDAVTPLIGTPATSSYVYAGNQPTVTGDPSGRTEGVDFPATGHSTESGNAVANAGYGVAVAKGATAAVVGFQKLYNVVNKIEETGGKSAASKLGTALSVVGIGLALYVAISDCMNGPIATCVGESVGVAISIGCLAISSGVGAAACGIIGLGIQTVIIMYGPQIVQGLSDFAQYAWEGSQPAIAAVSAAFEQAGADITGAYATAVSAVSTAYGDAVNAVTGAYDTAVGALATGFNTLSSAISSGYDSAISTLEQAGYTAVQMANVLADTFGQGLDEVVNQLNLLAYDVDGVAKALKSTFEMVDREVAALLKDLKYEFKQIGSALKAAFNDAADIAAGIIKDLGAGVIVIAQTLVAVYQAIDAEVAQVLKDLQYTVDQISGALKDVLQETQVALTNALQAVGYTLDVIAGTLTTVYNATVAEVAAFFQQAGETVTAIAGALRDAFAYTGTQVAQLFTTLGVAFDSIATALENAYGATAQAVSDILKSIGAGIEDIKNVLTDVFNQGISEIENILTGSGFVASAINALGDAFSSFGDDVSGVIDDIGDWLGL